MKEILVLILSIIVIFSCTKNEDSSLAYNMKISYKSIDYDIKNQGNLDSFVGKVIDKDGVLITSSSYEILLDGTNQEYQAIVGEYNLDGIIGKKIIITLDPNGMEKDLSTFSSFLVGCTMKCNEGDFCSTCGMTVEESCKRVICSCTKAVRPGSGCGVEISTY